MKPNPSKYDETRWGRASPGYYPKVKSRSSQGYIKVKSAKKGENSKFLLCLLQLYYFRMSIMVETHLGPNTEVHQTHLKILQGLGGNTP